MDRTFDGRLERLERLTPNRNSERLRIIRVIVDENGKVSSGWNTVPTDDCIPSPTMWLSGEVMTPRGIVTRIEKLEATNLLGRAVS